LSIKVISMGTTLTMRHGWLARHPLMHNVEKEAKRKLQVLLLLLLPSHL